MLLNFQSQLAASDIKLLATLNTPAKVQKYLDDQIRYNADREDRSVKEIIQDHQAECYNGALFGVACLTLAGFEASILKLAARLGDEEHILAVYQQNGYYGAVAQSKFQGLKNRQPMYRTIRDLAVSYLEFYFDFQGRLTLQAYTDLLPMEKYQLQWLNSGKVVAEMASDLNNLSHHDLVSLHDPVYAVESKRFWSEVQIIPDWAEIPERYLQSRP